ncbi:MAG: cupin domain-containing protein [Anaerovoracaceae bacterium]
MIIDFKGIGEKKIEAFKGGEKYVMAALYEDENNKIMKGKLVSGATIGLHRHETNSEVIYILEGKGKVLFEGEYEAVKTGSCHYCPKGCQHSLINDSNDDLLYFAIVPEHTK